MQTESLVLGDPNYLSVPLTWLSLRKSAEKRRKKRDRRRQTMRGEIQKELERKRGEERREGGELSHSDCSKAQQLPLSSPSQGLAHLFHSSLPLSAPSCISVAFRGLGSFLSFAAHNFHHLSLLYGRITFNATAQGNQQLVPNEI